MPRWLDQQLRLGNIEPLKFSTDMMTHPHAWHLVSILSRNGRAVDHDETRLKDVVWIDGAAVILICFDRPAHAGAPYVYHRQFLEREDTGMMGQFSAS